MADSHPTDPDARALTGAAGLDQLLGGGLPAQRLHLVGTSDPLLHKDGQAGR
jgi:hypothetical protein